MATKIDVQSFRAAIAKQRNEVSDPIPSSPVTTKVDVDYFRNIIAKNRAAADVEKTRINTVPEPFIKDYTKGGYSDLAKTPTYSTPTPPTPIQTPTPTPPTPIQTPTPVSTPSISPLTVRTSPTGQLENIPQQKPLAPVGGGSDLNLNPEVKTTGLRDELINTTSKLYGPVTKKAALFTGDTLSKLYQANDEAGMKYFNDQASFIENKTGKTINLPTKLPKFKDVNEYRDWQVANNQFIKALNSELGAKITGTIAKGTANIPLKTIAKIMSWAEPKQNDAYNAIMAERNNPNNGAMAKFLYNLQDSMPQSLIGVLLSMSATAASKGNPAVGRAVAMAYFGALSAEEQRQKKGKVTNMTDIIIDTYGDTVLGNSIEGILASSGKTSAFMGVLKGATAEGVTEPTQTLLKDLNDYAQSRTPEEKEIVKQEIMDYVKSGDMAMEFLVAAASGGLIESVTTLGAHTQLPAADIQFQPPQEKTPSSLPPENPPPGPDGAPVKVEPPVETPAKPQEKLVRTPEEAVQSGLITQKEADTTDQEFYNNLSTTAIDSDDLNAFAESILGSAASRYSNNNYVEPAVLDTDAVDGIYYKLIEDPKFVNAETGKLFEQFSNAEDPVVINSAGEIISGYQKLMEYAEDINSRNKPSTLPAIKLTPAGRVDKPTRNQLKIDEFYKEAKKQGTLFKRTPEGKPTTFRGAPNAGTATPKIARITRKVVSANNSIALGKMAFHGKPESLKMSKEDFIKNGIAYYKTTDEYKNAPKGDKLWNENVTRNHLNQFYNDSKKTENKIVEKIEKKKEPIKRTTPEKVDGFEKSIKTADIKKLGKTKVAEPKFKLPFERTGINMSIKEPTTRGQASISFKEKTPISKIEKYAREAKNFYEFYNKLTAEEKQSISLKMDDTDERRAAARFYNKLVTVNSQNKVEGVDIDYVKQKYKESQVREKLEAGKFMTPKETSLGGIVSAEVARQVDLFSMFKKMALPEQVYLYKELTGYSKLLLSNAKKYNGMFTSVGETGYITLNRSLFRKGDSFEQLSKTLAHEIGHMFDYLPNPTMRRGNILGRLYTLNYSFRNSFLEDPTIPDRINKIVTELLPKAKTEEESARLLNEIEKLRKSDKVQNSDVRAELIAISKYARPWLWESSYPKHKTYREQGTELYADYMSILFNDPGYAINNAPLFSSRFFDKLNNKPEVLKNLIELQSLLNGDPERIAEFRAKNLIEMFKRPLDVFKVSLNERMATKKDLFHNIKTALYYRYAWASERVKAAKKAGIAIPDSINPVYFMGRYDYSKFKVNALINKYFQKFYDEANELGISTEELSSLLFVERVSEDGKRQEIANPGGYTKDTAEEMRKYLIEQGGDAKKSEAIVRIVSGLRNGLLDVILEYKTLFDPAMIAEIKVLRKLDRENFYVPFSIMNNIYSALPATFRKQTGNLNDPNNLVHNILLKMIGVVRAGERNSVYGNIIKFLERTDPAAIKEPKTILRKEYVGMDIHGKPIVNYQRIPIETNEAGYKLISFRENRGMKHYYIPTYIAESMKYQTQSAIENTFKAANKVQSIFKELFTVLSPAFQLVNFFIRDPGKTVETFRVGEKAILNPLLQGKAYAQMIRYYIKAAPHATSLANGKYTEITLNMLEEGTLIGDYHGDVQLKSMLEGDDYNGVDITLRQLGMKITEAEGRKTIVGKTKDIAMMPINSLRHIGAIAEAMPKIVAQMYITEKGLFGSKAEQDDWIRNQVGSPNYMKTGTGKEFTNFFMLFYNATIRGLESNAKLYYDPRSRAAVWAGVFYTVFLPKLLQVAGELGLFDRDDDQEKKNRIRNMYLKVSEQEKNDNFVVPLGVVNGETVGIKMPQAEHNRFVGTMIRQVLLVALDKEMRKVAPVAKAMGRSIMYAVDQAPSMSPLISVILDASTVASGGNPVDSYTNKQLYTEGFKGASMDANELEKAKIFAKWAAGKLGAKTITSIIPNIPFMGMHNVATLLEQKEYFQKDSIYKELSRNQLTKRFTFSTSYGEKEYEKRVLAKNNQTAYEKKRDADTIITQAVQKYWDEKPTNMAIFTVEDVLDKLDTRYSNEEKNQKLQAFMSSLGKVSNETKLNMIDTIARDNNQKAILLLDWRKSISSKEFLEFTQEGYTRKIITDDVLEKLITMINEEQSK